MVAEIKQPWQPGQVQFIQPNIQKEEGGIGQQLLGKAAQNATQLGANSLAQSGNAGVAGLGQLFGGATTTAAGAAAPTLGSTFGSLLGTGAGAAGAGAAGAAGAGLAAAAAPIVAPLAIGAKLFGLFNEGTTMVPQQPMGPFGPDPLGLEDGTSMVPMEGYQQGVDSVPAMLTPGEAVIPAPAAQDPANQPMIQGMVEQGRAMNDGMDAPSPMQNGPLSGKTKREELKLMQDMSLKKKSWMADEKRKQEAHEQKMELDRQRASQAMRQSQE